MHEKRPGLSTPGASFALTFCPNTPNFYTLPRSEPEGMRHTLAMNPFRNIFTIAQDHGPVRTLYIRATMSRTDSASRLDVQ